MHIVISSLISKIDRQFTLNKIAPPKYVYGDNKTETSDLPVLIFTDPESDMSAVNSAGYMVEQLAIIVVLHTDEVKANQLSQVIIKYIGQNKMNIPLINEHGATIGFKTIDRLSLRPMANESGQRFGMSITVQWTDRKVYQGVESPLVGDMGVRVQDY